MYFSNLYRAALTLVKLAEHLSAAGDLAEALRVLYDAKAVARAARQDAEAWNLADEVTQAQELSDLILDREMVLEFTPGVLAQVFGR